MFTFWEVLCRKNMKLYKCVVGDRSFEGRLETVVTNAVKAGVTRTPGHLTTQGVWSMKTKEKQAWRPITPGPKITTVIADRAMAHAPKSKGRSVEVATGSTSAAAHTGGANYAAG